VGEQYRSGAAEGGGLPIPWAAEGRLSLAAHALKGVPGEWRVFAVASS
jgi:hypothetical protein